MYDRDMPKIAAYGLRRADNLVNVIAFVLCTIQQPFAGVARQMQDVRENGAEARALFGSKRGGYTYAVEHKRVLFAALKAAKRSNDAVAAVDVLALVPGLGVVKASFVAQLLGFEASCLDLHNCARLGIAPESLRLAKGLRPETKRAKIARYLDTCRDTGGARFWWNSWCEFVVGKRNKFASADAVSAFHVQCLAIA